MAKLIVNDQEKELPDGSPIQETAEDLGIPFGCTRGICGTCKVEVVSGEENLDELTLREKDMNRDRKNRLACQCSIKSGTVKIKW